MVSDSFRKFRNGKDVSGRCFIRVVGKQFFFDSTELNKTNLVLTPPWCEKELVSSLLFYASVILCNTEGLQSAKKYLDISDF
jgi:hypothetical protein